MIILPDGTPLHLEPEITNTFNSNQLISKLGSDLQSTCEAFLDSPACVNPFLETVHVVQGEFAEVSFTHGNVKVLGSSDATTCVVVILVDQSKGRAVVCHHDESTVRTLENIIQGIVPGMHAPELYLLGGALTTRNNNSTDDSRHSVSITTVFTLLQAFHNLPVDMKLKLFCALEWNTDPLTRSPRCQSLAVAFSHHHQQGTSTATATTTNVTAFAVPPGGWKDNRGPLIIPRLAQIWLDYTTNKHVRSVYNAEKGYWVVQLLQGASSSQAVLDKAMDEGQERSSIKEAYSSMDLDFSRMLDLSDRELLQCCSTSPECELSHIAGEIRECLQWVLEQTTPLGLVEHRFQFNTRIRCYEELFIE